MNTESIKKLEKLSNISINPLKLEKLSKNMINILNYIDILSKVTIKDLPETFNNSGKLNVVVNDDEVLTDHLSAQDVLKNAPQTYKNYFKVNKVIDL